MHYPRLLVLSNNSFSKSNSNGRTLGNLLKGWPKDKIAQFCLSSDGADFDVCENYYCVTDGAMLTATKKLTAAPRTDLRIHSKEKTRTTQNVNDAKSPNSGISKTSFTMLLRNLLWGLNIWQGKEFWNWIYQFNPEVILLQSGDSFFMHKLSLKIAKKTGAKLTTFNSEGYYFFDHDYFSNDNLLTRKLLYPIYRRFYRHAFEKFMNNCSASIYLNKALMDDYREQFPHDNGHVCYSGSDMSCSPSEELGNPPTFAYMGNLGIKRPEALAEFAQVLNTIAPDCHIDVYGKLPNNYNGIFEITEGIRYHGLVSYEKVKEIIYSTDFIIHVEKDDPVLTNELRYAFSTKLADSICSGRNFIVYAPATLACSKYIKDTGAAWLATTKDELSAVLERALTKPELRRAIVEKARITAANNHNAAKNSSHFQTIISSICHAQ